MPWWGWVLVIIAVIIGLWFKIKILKKMFAKKDEEHEEY